MSDEEDLQRIADATDEAIRALGWMPLRTVVVSEILTGDGEREVATAISRDLRAQDSLGLLGYALARERAGVTREVLGEDEP